MSVATKKALAQSRDASYRIPDGNRCGTCRHAWFRWNGDTNGQCHLVEIRGKLVMKDVSIYGTCAEYDAKENSQ